MKLDRLICLSSLLALPVLASCTHDGKTGADGQKGTKGAKGEPEPSPLPPQINLIDPRVGLVDRTLDVSVAFDGAIDLSKVDTIDFGDGVTVKSFSVVANAVVASLEIAQTAKLGRHDVTVTMKNDTTVDGTPDTARAFLAKSGFVVAVPLDTKIYNGKAEQGGLVRLAVSNRDKIWFDTEKFQIFPLVKAHTASVVGLSQSFTATDGTVVFLGDPLAKTGPLQLLGFNDPSDDTSASFLSEPDALTVAARTPTPLASGTPIAKTFDNDLDTGFFSADITAPASADEGILVEARANVPSDSTMAPMILGYPESGSIENLLDQAKDDPGFPAFGIPATQARVAYPAVTTKSTKAYFIVVDAGLKHGPTVKLSMTFNTSRAAITAENTAPHADGPTAQSLGPLPAATSTIPARIVNGELASKDEVDVYRITNLSATAVTDLLVSVSGDANVVVKVDTVPTFDSDAVVGINQGGTVGSAATSGLVGKDRYIQVSAKADGAKPTGKYSLGIKRLPTITQ